MKRKTIHMIYVLTVLLGLLGSSTRMPVAAFQGTPQAALAPSPWYARGDFNGWGTTNPLVDDGTNGDLVPDDGIFTADVTIATANRYEWKVATADWSISYPTSGNSWLVTTIADQTVRLTFDTNTYSDGWAPQTTILNANDDLTAWTAVGDWQGWQNGAPATAMTAVGYGRYLLAYPVPAAGSHEYKAVRTGTWDAIGADNRSANASTVAFTTSSPNQTVYFLLDLSAGRIRAYVPGTPPASPWYARGDFNGWGTTNPLYDDGTNGDLLPADGVFSAEVTIATANRYEWKVATADWGTSYPGSGNSWLVTTVADQVVRLTFDTNTYSDGWAPQTNILNANDDVVGWTAVGDWQGWGNSNPATAMTAAGYGRYLLAYPVPAAGSHEYKAVRTGTWDAVGADNRSINAGTVTFNTASPNEIVYFWLDLTSGRIQAATHAVPGHDDTVWWDGLEHNSRDDLYRAPFGAVPKNTPVKLRFRTYAGDVTEVKVRVWDTALAAQALYPMAVVATIPGDPYDYEIWELELAAPDYLTILYYRFVVTDGADTDYYEDDGLFDGGLGQAYDDSPDYSYQIDVHDPAFDTPDWFKDAVVYQIFPDRFRNGVAANDPISGTFFYGETPGVLEAPQWNWIVPDPRLTGPWAGSYSKLFYGGDLQGIIDQIDYLEDLGVTTLYLNPIFESPSNHKYDTTNYEIVDDNFGDLATFQALVAELDARDMHLVLDGVFNHTSSDSSYFDRYGRYSEVGACEDVNSPYRSWYYFTPASPPGTGVCAGDTNYQAWWGFDSLPKLNTTDEQTVRDYLYRTVPAIGAYWLSQGADGWRLDVAGDVNSTFWQDWRPYIRTANPDAITIAEEWGDASRFILGDQLDSAMNYRFRNALIGLLRETDWQDTNSVIPALTVSQFDSLMHSIEEDYPAEAWYATLNLVDSHDTNRVLIPLDQDGDPTDSDYTDGKARQKVLAIVQMTMPGAPTIYYGDEVGLTGFGQASGDNPGGVFYSDPYNRQPFPWPDEPGYGDLPAWRQQDTTMQAHYTALTAIRNAHPALRTGSFDTLLADDATQVYAYGRKLGNDAAVVVVNRNTTAQGVRQAVSVDVSGYLPEGTALTDELNGGSYTVTGGQIALTVAPLWGAVLTVDTGQDLTPPAAPPNLFATENDSLVQLSWNAVAGAASYNLYRSYVTGGGYTLIASGLAGTTHDDTTVTNGTWYYYVVTALDAAGNESARSNEAAALPHKAIGWAGGLEPTTIVHTIGITPTEPISAQVWIVGLTEPVGQGAGVMAEVGYGISGTLPSTWEVWIAADYVGDVGANDQYAASLTPEMTGTFQYLARFSTTQGRDWSYASTAGGQRGVLTVLPSGDATPPVKPLNLRVADWAAGWIALAWEPVTGDPTLYAYDLFRSEVSGTVGTKIARVLAPTTVYTDTAVTSGQAYYYVVQAVDTSFNRSGYSNQVEATAAPKMVAVTFQAVVPDYTPADATVYVVGDAADLCSWCNPQTVALTKTGEVTWTRVITLPDGLPIQYKYTRGNWDTNEWWGPIVSLENRHATVNYGTDGQQLLADTVYYWRDPLVIDHQPVDGATDVDPAATISVTLSRFLDPATITPDNVTVSGGAAAPVLEIGFFHHTEMTATTILLTPTVPLDEGAIYVVTLRTGLQGLDADNGGITLQREYVWGFQTAGGYWYYLPVILRSQ